MRPETGNARERAFLILFINLVHNVHSLEDRLGT